MTHARWFRMVAVAALAGGLAACPKDRDPVDPDIDTLAIATAALPTGVVGEDYSAGVDAQGGSGDYSWDLASGALPTGLGLSVEDLVDNDLLITGVPENAGTFTFVLRVTSGDGQTRSRTLAIQILPEPAPIAIGNVALGPALVGASYLARLEATGGDGVSYAWSLAAGTLPSGLTLTTSGQDGIIQGTPTAPDTSAIVIRVASGGFEVEEPFTLQVVANRTGTYDITVAPVVPIPTDILPQLDAAVARWQQAITGNLPTAPIDPTFFNPGSCSGFGVVVNGTSADDLIVLVNIVSIDGPGQVLGQAGPCAIRGSNDLTLAGVLTLDADDLGGMSAQARTDLIVHELGHVIGFGSLWETVFDLLTASTSDPRFTGSFAVAEWNALGGAGQVPVEATGGEGTARSHWRETVFGLELMTGFSNPNTTQPLSRVSIASLRDMGYTVNMNAADAFSLSSPMGAPGHDPSAAYGYDVVLDEIIYRAETDGRVTTIRRER